MQRRIKTLEEMKQEFGKNWRTKLSVPFHKQGEMDYLLGSILSNRESHAIEVNKSITLQDEIGTWRISIDATVVEDQTAVTEMKRLLHIYTHEQLLDALLLCSRED